jgi:hypothetical protein
MSLAEKTNKFTAVALVLSLNAQYELSSPPAHRSELQCRLYLERGEKSNRETLTDPAFSWSYLQVIACIRPFPTSSRPTYDQHINNDFKQSAVLPPRIHTMQLRRMAAAR